MRSGYWIPQSDKSSLSFSLLNAVLLRKFRVFLCPGLKAMALCSLQRTFPRHHNIQDKGKNANEPYCIELLCCTTAARESLNGPVGSKVLGAAGVACVSAVTRLPLVPAHMDRRQYSSLSWESQPPP